MSRTPLLHLLRRALRPQTSADLPRVPRAALTRRALLAGGAAALGAAALPRGARAARGRRVAVIGSGLAGLAAAQRLEAAGATVSVIEAGPRVGGRVFSAPAPFDRSLVLDLGGSFINSDHEDMLALAEGLALPLFARETAGEAGIPAEAFLLGGALREEAAVAAALAPLAEAVAADAARLDADWDSFAPAIDALSVAQYLDAVLPSDTPGWARALVEATIRTEYGVEPEEASALELVFLAPEVDGEAVTLLGSSDEAFVVQGGAGLIPRGLAGRLNGNVHLNRPVTAIRDHGDGVEIVDRNGDSMRFDAALVACPLPALRRIALEADLPEGFLAMVAEGRLGRNEKVIGGFDGRPWREAGRFTHAAWSDLGFASVWDETLRQSDAHHAALTFFFGAGETRALDPMLSSEEMLEGPRYRLASHVPGLEARALNGAVATGWRHDGWAGGGYTSFAPGAYARFAEWLWVEGDEGVSGPAFGRLAFAGEHLSDAFYGYMNGAAETGRLAADHLIAAA